MRSRSLLIGTGYLAAVLALNACDPCAGVGSCTTDPRVAAQGRIVDAESGRGVADAEIALVRTDGATRDSAVATTDVGGNYQLALDGPSGVFDVVVAPAGLPSYRVRKRSLASTTSHGAGYVLGVWVATPRLNVATQLFYRADPTQVVTNAFTVFHRTGGATITPDIDFGAPTDAAGRVTLMPNVVAAGADDVIGTLSVFLPGTLGKSVLENLHVQPDYEFRPQTVHRIGVGPQLSRIAAVYDRATGARVPGTRVTFTRTGGIATSAETFSTVTNASGEFVFPLVPLESGTLVGDMTIEPPPPFRSYTRTALQIPTFDGDNNPFLGDFGVGPHLPWDGTLQCNGKPVKGATVFVVRVGGIAAEPSSFYSTSDANGNFNMSVFKPKEYGTLIVDLEITVPPGSECIGLVQHNVQLPTLDIDSDIRFVATWVLPRP